MTADTSVYVTDGGAIHYETAAIDWRIFPAGSLEKDVPFTFALKYSKRQDTLEFYLNGVKSRLQTRVWRPLASAATSRPAPSQTPSVRTLPSQTLCPTGLQLG